MVDEIDRFAEQWARVGAPPVRQIRLSASNQAPRLGDTVRLEWNTTLSGRDIVLYRNGRHLVRSSSARGFVDLMVRTPEPMEICAECADMRSRCRIVPVLRLPVFEVFDLARTVHLGDGVTLDLRARDAISLQVEVVRLDTNQTVWTRTFDEPERRVVIPLDSVGHYVARVRAIGADHAHVENAVVCRERRVRVAHPPAEIRRFAVSEPAPNIGKSTVHLSWRVVNAERVWLRSLRGETDLAETEGRLSIESPASAGAQRYVLLACNAAGDVESEAVVVRWSHAPVTIRLEMSRMRLDIGESHDIRWDTSGAREVSLAVVQRDRTRVLSRKGSGRMSVTPSETTRYSLSAVGTDGRVHRRRAVVQVDLMPDRRSFVHERPSVSARTRLPLPDRCNLPIRAH